jgi:predicted nucleic acid-binding protein
MKFYLDTSVFGGFFDKEFEEPTKELFNFIEDNNIEILYSPIVEEELELAPIVVKLLADQFLASALYINITKEMENLSQLYVYEGALTNKSASDASHIAIATIGGADAIVTWNFKHMANFIRIKQYNSINLSQGYKKIDIYTPRQIIGH